MLGELLIGPNTTKPPSEALFLPSSYGRYVNGKKWEMGQNATELIEIGIPHTWLFLTQANK